VCNIFYIAAQKEVRDNYPLKEAILSYVTTMVAAGRRKIDLRIDESPP